MWFWVRAVLITVYSVLAVLTTAGVLPLEPPDFFEGHGIWAMLLHFVLASAIAPGLLGAMHRSMDWDIRWSRPNRNASLFDMTDPAPAIHFMGSFLLCVGGCAVVTKWLLGRFAIGMEECGVAMGLGTIAGTWAAVWLYREHFAPTPKRVPGDPGVDGDCRRN
ncbi:MAG: hypothetical protein PVJ57_01785 [Phycisphaerae bacterium]|jgi:hypothetical protein